MGETSGIFWGEAERGGVPLLWDRIEVVTHLPTQGAESLCGQDRVFCTIASY